MKNVKKWIWEHERYPEFDYDYKGFADSIAAVFRNTGRLEYAVYLLEKKSINSFIIDASADEAVESSKIEGEIVERESVCSSIKKRLNFTFDHSQDKSNRYTDGLADILIDSTINHKPLTKERLHGWHNALFPTGYSGGYKIDVAKYRKGEMSVVSKRGYSEVTHYIAPPHTMVDEEMNKLLNYINYSQEDPYIKSAVAHIWFVSIHPYDDGNGRIARAMANYVLSKELGLNYHYFSISKEIEKNKKNYYEILEKSQNLFYNKDFDFTEWIKWHTDMVNNAIEASLKEIEKIIKKAKFWDKARNFPLNKRQIKVLNKILDIGIENFKGGLSTKKYVNITKTSIPTAKRDISKLLKFGLIEKIEGSAGRNTSYMLKID